MITDTRTVTYSELDRAADGVASIIAGSDTLGRGPVAFWGDRDLETVAAVWGIPRAGVSAVAIDPRMDPARSMDATRAVGARGLWALPDGGFDRLVSAGRGWSRSGPAADVPWVVFTSGSLGEAKGVRLTASNVEAAVSASRQRLGNGPEDRWLCVLPLFHVGGLSILWRQGEAAAPVVLHDGFDADMAVEALETVTFASLVPVMLRRILEGGHTWRNDPVVLVGGAGVDDELLLAAREAGLRAVRTYGMTETCSQIATAAPDDPIDGTAGLPLAGAQVRVTVEGRSVVGAVGLIEVRGPMVSPGYVGDPGRSADAWTSTRDLGILEPDGRIVVVGRADAVVVSGGHNVHPLEVERLLARNPTIRASRVYGVDDEVWGSRLVAEVESESTTDALADWAAAHLPPSHRPREWLIVEHVDGKLSGGRSSDPA